MAKIIKKGDKLFDKAISNYVHTPHGQMMAMYLLEQLISEVHVTNSGHPIKAVMDPSKPLVLDIE